MISELAVFESSTCSCGPCRSICTGGRPGALAPSDLDHIAEFFGMDEVTPEFLTANFRACVDGPAAPTDKFPSGETPVLRPATRADGRCVFLGTGGCTCHPVAPFECRQTKACDPADGAAAMRALGVSITRSTDYVQTWWWLHKRQNS